MAKRRPSGDGMVRLKKENQWEGRIVVGHKQNGDSIFRYAWCKQRKEVNSSYLKIIENMI